MPVLNIELMFFSWFWWKVRAKSLLYGHPDDGNRESFWAWIFSETDVWEDTLNHRVVKNRSFLKVWNDVLSFTARNLPIIYDFLSFVVFSGCCRGAMSSQESGSGLIHKPLAWYKSHCPPTHRNNSDIILLRTISDNTETGTRSQINSTDEIQKNRPCR